MGNYINSLNSYYDKSKNVQLEKDITKVLPTCMGIGIKNAISKYTTKIDNKVNHPKRKIKKKPYHN